MENRSAQHPLDPSNSELSSEPNSASATQSRPRTSLSQLKGILKIIRESGLELTAPDSMPDGSFRWHFAPPADNDDDAIARSLAEFDAKLARHQAAEKLKRAPKPRKL